MSLLFALVVQLAYTPFHLAYEEHDGISGAQSSESTTDAFVAACHHEHDRGQHDDGHPCHAIQDHGGELMVPSVSSAHKALASHAVLAEKPWSLSHLCGLGWARTPEVETARVVARMGRSSRGPPAIA